VFAVIDTILYRKAWLSRYPHMPQQEGLMAVIAPIEGSNPFRAGGWVRVSRTDGSSVDLQVVEVRHNPDDVVGLFFSENGELEIPRGSMIEPLNRCF
jgi:hypothetical protein